MAKSWFFEPSQSPTRDGEFHGGLVLQVCICMCSGACAKWRVSIQSVEQVAGGSDDLISTEDEGYELLSQATNWSRAGQGPEGAACISAESPTSTHYNGAGHDAKISIESLRTKIGSDRERLTVALRQIVRSKSQTKAYGLKFTRKKRAG